MISLNKVMAKMIIIVTMNIKISGKESLLTYGMLFLFMISPLQ